MGTKFGAVLCALLVCASLGCSRRDQERAREKAAEAREKVEAAAERARREASKLGREAKQEARVLSRKADQTLEPSGNNPDGRGPNGKLRASAKLDHAALIAKVKAKLAADVGLSTITGVDVDATGHVVTLSGTVSSSQEKRQAEKAVASLTGVTRVVDHLRVEP